MLNCRWRRCLKKTVEDLEFVCDLGVDWLALSFVQRAADVEEARDLARGRAAILSKIEKPIAVEAFDDILRVSTASWWPVAIWVLNCRASVPPIQKRWCANAVLRPSL